MISHSQSANNRWSNWQGVARTQGDWAGVVFGYEDITKDFIDNLEVDFYTDSGCFLPASYKIQYYDGAAFERPTDPNNVPASHPLGNDANWKDVNHLKLVSPANISSAATNYFAFDAVKTSAIRIKMQPQPGKSLAITEMVGYAKLVDKSPVIHTTEIAINGKPLTEFNNDRFNYNIELEQDVVPDISVKTAGNESVTIVSAQDANSTARIIVTAEDGVATQIYQIHFNYNNSNPVTPKSTLTGVQQVLSGQTFTLTMGLTDVTQSVYQQVYAQDFTLQYDPASVQFDSVTSLKDGFRVIDTKGDGAGTTPDCGCQRGRERACPRRFARNPI